MNCNLRLTMVSSTPLPSTRRSRRMNARRLRPLLLLSSATFSKTVTLVMARIYTQFTALTFPSPLGMEIPCQYSADIFSEGSKTVCQWSEE